MSCAGGCGCSGISRGAETWLGTGSILREEHVRFANVGYEIKRCIRMMPGSWPQQLEEGVAIN